MFLSIQIRVGLFTLAITNCGSPNPQIQDAAISDTNSMIYDSAVVKKDSSNVKSDNGVTYDAASFGTLNCFAHQVSQSPKKIEITSGAPPSGKNGGAISDGHYRASRIRLYYLTKPLVTEKAADLWIAAGRYEWEEDNGNFGTDASSGKISYAGAKMVLTPDCRLNFVLSLEYTKTTNGLQLWQPINGGGVLVYDMEKIL